MSELSNGTAAHPRKRRRVLEQEEALGETDAPAPDAADDGEEEEEEVVELSSGWTPQSAPPPQPAPTRAAAVAAARAAMDDDDVQIVGSRASPAAASSAASQPKRLRLTLGGQSSSRMIQPSSPTAPPLEEVSPPPSPEVPIASPIITRQRLADYTDTREDDEKDEEAEEAAASVDAREELAVRRARARKGANASPVAIDEPVKTSAAQASAAAAAAVPSGPIRRRKAPAPSAAASSLASASLTHSYATTAGVSGVSSHLPPELQWHQDNSVLCPNNASDRVDVERTFLQQVLPWDPFAVASSPHVTDAAGGGAKDVPREMQAFSRFLDPAVPLPVHFTTPLAYLGYFGPIVLDNFRAQMSQTVAMNVGELRPAPAAPAKAAAPMPGGMPAKPAPPAMVPVLSPAAERYRSTWTAASLSPCSVINGGGDDWFELRLKLATPHRSLNELSGADVIVLGIDEPTAGAPAASAVRPNVQMGLLPTPNVGPPPPPPTQHALYVFAFLDGVNPDAGACYARTRLFLPGVSSSLSSYVANTGGSTARNRFQLIYNRLVQACGSGSAPESEGGLNRAAHFGPSGAGKSGLLGGGDAGPTGPPQYIYLTRIETIITTMREYTALVKVGCLLGLRLQSELLRPSAAFVEGEDDDDNTAASAVALHTPDARAAAVVVDDEDAPPALEDITQVVKADIKAIKRRTPAASALASSSQAHRDSAAWIGLPGGFREFVCSTLNEHQLKAVQVALQRYEKPGFTLLQGPPGTGKSKTVVALLNALHLGAYQRHYDSLITQLETGQPPSSFVTLKPRILVCAPSNTAVDELITRVLETGVQHKTPEAANAGATSVEKKTQGSSAAAGASLPRDQAMFASLRGQGGFVDGQRMRYKPDIVRVGNSDAMRAELKSIISLDALVDNYHRLTEADLQTRLSNARSFIAQQERTITDLRVLHGKSALVVADQAKLMDSLAKLGHDVRQQAQYAQFEAKRNEHLALQRNIARAFEQRTLAVQDAHRCELALQFKIAGRPASAGGSGAGFQRRDREAALDSLRISFLNQAQIVFCTLSGAGLELLSRLDQPFRALIVDEAAQCTEVAALIPLTHDVQHCVLVGDPRQLPATVFSQDAAAKRMWERSLFERLEQSGHQMHALTTQYRMHSDIRLFPSDYFYKGLLQDADFIKTGSLYKQPYHAQMDFLPLLFFDLQSASARGGPGGAMDPSDDPALSRSMGNIKEAILIVNMLSTLLQRFPATNAKQIGIITFYQKQKTLLQEQLRARAMQEASMAQADAAGVASGNAHAGASSMQQQAKVSVLSTSSTPAAKAAHAVSVAASSGSTLAQQLLSIEVSTVDGFQGREKDIIVVSCVRGGSTGGLGFVDDVRRMNVALTRAKYACWVVGDSRALRRSEHWGAFLESAARRSRYRAVQPGDFQNGQTTAQYTPHYSLHQEHRWGHSRPQQQQQQMQLQAPSQQHGAGRMSPQPLPPHLAAGGGGQQRGAPLPGSFSGQPPPGFAVVDLGAAAAPFGLPQDLPPPPGYALLQMPPQQAAQTQYRAPPVFGQPQHMMQQPLKQPPKPQAGAPPARPRPAII